MTAGLGCMRRGQGDNSQRAPVMGGVSKGPSEHQRKGGKEGGRGRERESEHE